MPASTTLSSAETYARAVDLVARRAGLRPEQVRQPSSHAARRARGAALYLTVVGGGHGVRPSARVAGLDHVGVMRWLRKIEDQRDDVGVDRTLTHLEEQLACAI